MYEENSYIVPDAVKNTMPEPFKSSEAQEDAEEFITLFLEYFNSLLKDKKYGDDVE
jgi:hypothetical protein